MKRSICFHQVNEEGVLNNQYVVCALAPSELNCTKGQFLIVVSLYYSLPLIESDSHHGDDIDVKSKKAYYNLEGWW